MNINDPKAPRINQIITLVYPRVITEILKGEQRHGPLTGDLVRSHLLMAEEMGEYARAVADLTRTHGKWNMSANEGDWGRRVPLTLDDARVELAQALALGTVILEQMLTGSTDIQKQLAKGAASAKTKTNNSNTGSAVGK